MAFQLDFDNTFEGGAIEDGTYEVIIEKAHEDATKNGAEFINFWFRIRNDIQQKSQNQIIFHRIWKAKDSGKYSPVMINTLGKSAKLQNGKSYTSMEELLNDFIRKPLKATVKNETSEYNGKTYENLNVKYTAETAFPNVQHQWKAKEQNGTNNGYSQFDQDPFDKTDGPIDISDDDLPF